MSEQGCYYCGTTERELKPYGPGSSPLCFQCLESDPEIEEAAGIVFAAQVAAAAAASDIGSVVIEGGGPNPLMAADVERLIEGDE